MAISCKNRLAKETQFYFQEMRSAKFDTSETPKTSRNLRAVLNKSLLRNISVYGYVSVTKKEQIRLLSAGS